MMAAKSVSDQPFIKALPSSVVEAFRHLDYVPNDLKICMRNHPHLFKNSLDWIVVADLRMFIDENVQVLDDVYMPSDGDLQHIEQFLATVASDSSFSTCTLNVEGSLLQYLYDGEPDGERAPKRPRWE
ncbi:hypothetical protein PM082_024763 [Marasmius tenuissimus]|nr:hypothetical protein PM082_024763 [Marasmius tenuissimus]